jgi:predicted transcriptional regulator
MVVTLSRMPRRRKSREGEEPRKESATDVVRIDADLARKIRVIALAEDRPASDILSERLRAYIDAEYPKALKKLAEREQQN